MLFTPIYENQICPLPGYNLEVIVLANPTNKQWNDFLNGALEADPYLNRHEAEGDEVWEQRLAESRETRRAQLGGALVALYNSKVYGEVLDFSTPEKAIASITHDDMPDEIVAWLLELPITVRNRRVEEMQKKLRSPSTAKS